jgi:hypothetical protein
MTRIHEEFFTKARAEAFRQATLLAYPPKVFGTILRVALDRSGFWKCAGARFAA